MSTAEQAATNAEAVQQARASELNRPRLPKIDETKLFSAYANFCRVTGTPEELLVDFGLNAQPLEITGEPIVVNQRIVMNYYTAKRMLHALGASIARHEAVFGPLEIDVMKRAGGGK
jgi:hypothetical protein